jgi:hypothetical protein
MKTNSIWIIISVMLIIFFIVGVFVTLYDVLECYLIRWKKEKGTKQ